MRSMDDYVKLLIDDPHEQGMKDLEQLKKAIEGFSQNRPKELVGFKEHFAKVNKFATSIKGITYAIDMNKIVTAIQQDVLALQESWAQERDDEYAEIDAQLFDLKAQIEAENKAHNQAVRDRNTQDNEGFKILEAKRKELETYSDKIIDVCAQYGITTSDINVSEDMFTFEEINSLYDKYLEYVSRDENKGNAIRTFRKLCPSAMVQGIVLLTLLGLCFTQLLDAIALVFFGLLAFNQSSQAKRVKYYSVLMGITFKINPMEMGFVAFDESQLLPEELTDEMLDTDERFAGFEDMYVAIEDKYEETNPENLQVQMMNEFESRRADFRVAVANKEKEFKEHHAEIIAMADKEIEDLRALYKKYRDEFKTVGDKFSSHLYFSDDYVLGLKDECIVERVTIGLRNIIFRGDPNGEEMKKFIRLMVANALCNVFPGKVAIKVYDPNSMGRSLMAFYTQDMSPYLEIESSDINKILDPLVGITQQNFKDMGGQDIQQFNMECEEVGKTPKEYNLLIVLSQPKTLEEDEKLNNFMTYSAAGGTFVWVVSDVLDVDNTFIFNKPYEGVQHPLTNIDDAWCKKVTSNFLEALDKMKTPSLGWRDFMANVIPADKTWTGDASKFVEFYPGYLNGDPTSYKPYTIGNEGNVHVIGVGGTGAGKSVFLNHLITSCCTLYHPSEIELWLCDFKGVEFKAYLANDAHPFMLPHIAACLCTSDPDFGASLFNAFRNMADRRYEDMKFIGVKNMPGWNTFVKGHMGEKKPEELVVYHREDLKEADYSDTWEEGDVWARSILICDEFQVIFQKADPKNVEKITADITQIAKVARAAGAHIFFTSQSMKGTVSDDILQQFTLRFALRCDKEVSMAILGTQRASDIREKNGYLIVRSVEMTLNDQKRYRTPFLNDSPPKKPDPDGTSYSELHKVIRDLYQRAIDEGYKFRDVITYEESTKHPIEQLIDTYKDENIIAKLPAKSGVFFLGNRMAYSKNRAPDNIIMGAQNNENIFSVFNDYKDFVLFFKTIVTNIRCNEIPGNIIINSQVKDLAYITEAEDYITNEKHKHLLSEKVSCAEIVKWLTELKNHRIKNEIKDKPVWIILLGWDKGSGIGVEPDGLVRSELGVLLQTCGETNMHIIFINNGMGSITAAIVEACRHRIVGKCSQDESSIVIGTRQGSVMYDGMKTGWLFRWQGGEITRDKLYISPITREIAKSEVVL